MKVLKRIGDNSTAYQILEKLSNDYPSHPTILLELAKKDAEQNRFKEDV